MTAEAAVFLHAQCGVCVRVRVRARPCVRVRACVYGLVHSARIIY